MEDINSTGSFSGEPTANVLDIASRDGGSGDGLGLGEVTSLNAMELDVHSPSHQIVSTQSNICSKTCNSN